MFGMPTACSWVVEFVTTSFHSSSALDPGFTSYTPGMIRPSSRRSASALLAYGTAQSGTPSFARSAFCALAHRSFGLTQVLLPFSFVQEAWASSATMPGVTLLPFLMSSSCVPPRWGSRRS